MRIVHCTICAVEFYTSILQNKLIDMADIKPLCAKNLAVESKPLFVPPLNEVAKGKEISQTYK